MLLYTSVPCNLSANNVFLEATDWCAPVYIPSLAVTFCSIIITKYYYNNRRRKWYQPNCTRRNRCRPGIAGVGTGPYLDGFSSRGLRVIYAVRGAALRLIPCAYGVQPSGGRLMLLKSIPSKRPDAVYAYRNRSKG